MPTAKLKILAKRKTVLLATLLLWFSVIYYLHYSWGTDLKVSQFISSLFPAHPDYQPSIQYIRKNIILRRSVRKMMGVPKLY